MTAATIATLGSIVALATGVTFGLFSAYGTAQSNTFSTGTVSLTSPDTGTVDCAITNAVPGDTGSCVLTATYTGSVPAWMALDTSDTSGGNLITDGGLTYTITDDASVTYTHNGTNDFVGAAGLSTHTFTINWSIPIGYTNQNNTGATITMQAHVVQSAHNAAGGCTAGAPCALAVGWS